jgi:hypothetical protein
MGIMAPAARGTAFAFATLLVVGACVAPEARPPAASTAEAQATAARRAQRAVVQRIIAGELVPTVTPEPMPTQVPTCARALWWHEVRAHAGESRVIQGPVVRTRPGPGGSTWLEIGQPYPDPTGVAVLVQADGGAALMGKTVCVDGRISASDSVATIDARGATRIVVLDQSP